MIKPDGYMNIGKIIDMIYNKGKFTISKLKLCKFTKDNAAEFYAEHYGKPFYDFLINYVTSDYVVGMELVKKDAIKEWRNFIGPTNVVKAQQEAPNSIRALFGTKEKNTVHGSDCQESVNREINIVFKKIKHKPTLTNCACLLIKPHAIAEGNAGKIIDMAENAGYPDSIADAVTALYSSGEITGIGKISETDRTSKEYRLSLDAVDAALGGNRI